VDGNSLVILSATRVHIGKYYCIASNGIPPTVSKSITLKVQCKNLSAAAGEAVAFFISFHVV
jgi:hypothetical protein